MIYASPIVDPCSSPVYSCPWRPRLVPVAVEQTNSRNPPFHNGRSSTGQCKRLPYIFPQRGAAWIFLWVHIVSPGLVHNCAAQDNQIRRRARSVPLTCHASTSLDSAQLVLQSTKTKVTHGIHLFEITNRFFFGNESHWRCVTSQHPPCEVLEPMIEGKIGSSGKWFPFQWLSSKRGKGETWIWVTRWSFIFRCAGSGRLRLKRFPLIFIHCSSICQSGLPTHSTQYTVHNTQRKTNNTQHTTKEHNTAQYTKHTNTQHTQHTTHIKQKIHTKHGTQHTAHYQ